MTGCSFPVQPGDVVTWLGDGDAELEMEVINVEQGTAHMCLIVGAEHSIWDWQVTHVNGIPVP